MTTFYWTLDLDDHGQAVREDCQFNRANSQEAACQAARAALLKQIDPEHFPAVEVGEIGESDCWSKVPADWSDDQISDYAREKGLDPHDVYAARPGQHPGLQNKTWLSVCPGRVFAATLTHLNP